MAYEVEDEVDWSDGTIESSPPPDNPTPPAQTERTSLTPEPEPRESAKSTLQAEEFQAENSELFEIPQCQVPSGEPLSSYSSTKSASSGSRPNCAQRTKIGPISSHRKPTKEEYSHFALYQASQKTYEAVFLKDFLNHALASYQVESCFGDRSNGDWERVAQYLRSVLTNVNQMVTKMVWNAHSRAINILASDGKESANFLDFRKLDTHKHHFSDFSPTNIFPVVYKMNESWHRTFNDLVPMVRYSPKDYPIGTHTSPLEEIDEIADTLFKKRPLDDSLSAGRAVRLPSKKRKTNDRVAARAERDASSRSNWMNQLTTAASSTIPYSTQHPASVPSLGGPFTLRTSPCAYRLDSGTASRSRHSFSPQSSLVPYRPNSGLASANTTATNPDAANLEESYRERHHQNQPTQLETLVQRYGTNILLDISNRIDQDNAARLRASKETASRKMLLEHQKHHLAKYLAAKRKRAGKPYALLRNLINRAVKHGKLLPPSPAAQEILNSIERKELSLRKREQRRKVATNGGEPGNTIGSSPISVSTSQNPKPSGPHPSGSKTLELHQNLPPDAYFVRKFNEDFPAWRCGIEHTMGYYYNAGNRKNCHGCNTSLSANPKARWMDFYLPLGKYYFQPAPDKKWKPSADRGKERKQKYLSHNSVGKDAWYVAIYAGATEDEAREEAIKAVKEHLRSKPPPLSKPRLKQKKRRQPIPDPSPDPIDLGPHPSGSLTLEHGQGLPQGARWEPIERGDQFAWRCDTNHALGRYYIAGNMFNCKGCGAARKSRALNKEMDFFLARGVFVSQSAPGLSKWRPRKLKKNAKGSLTSHNQMCSKKYWEAVDKGMEHDEALALAIDQVKKEVERKSEKKIPGGVTNKVAKPAKTVVGSSKASNHRPGKQVTKKHALSSERVSDSEQISEDSEDPLSDAESIAATESPTDDENKIDSDDSLSDGQKARRFHRGVFLHSSTSTARKRSHDEMMETSETDLDDLFLDTNTGLVTKQAKVEVAVGVEMSEEDKTSADVTSESDSQ